jgi:hypothetical protein
MRSVAILAVVWLLGSHCAALAAWQDTAQSGDAPADSRSAARPEWELLFDDDVTALEYARQLDYFKIEIGAVSKNGKIEYIAKVSQRKPERRVGYAESEYRLRIGWKRGALVAADRKLLAKAGINSQGKELWHYFPIDVHKQLAELERDYAGLAPGRIRRTRFQIRPKGDGGGYEFVVLEQDPPKGAQQSASPARSLNQPAVR